MHADKRYFCLFPFIKSSMCSLLLAMTEIFWFCRLGSESGFWAKINCTLFASASALWGSLAPMNAMEKLRHYYYLLEAGFQEYPINGGGGMGGKKGFSLFGDYLLSKNFAMHLNDSFFFFEIGIGYSRLYSIYILIIRTLSCKRTSSFCVEPLLKTKMNEKHCSLYLYIYGNKRSSC